MGGSWICVRVRGSRDGAFSSGLVAGVECHFVFLPVSWIAGYELAARDLVSLLVCPCIWLFASRIFFPSLLWRVWDWIARDRSKDGSVCCQ